MKYAICLLLLTVCGCGSGSQSKITLYAADGRPIRTWRAASTVWYGSSSVSFTADDGSKIYVYGQIVSETEPAK